MAESISEHNLDSERGLRPNAALRHSSGPASKLLHRVLSTLAHVLGFGLIALALHEFFQLVVLQALGGEGFITFGSELGFTHITELPSHVWAVQLSGGLLTGAFLLVVFWFWAWTSRSAPNINMQVAAFAWGFGYLAYAPVEMVTSSATMGAMAFGIGFGVAGVLYFTRLMNWLASGDLNSQPAGQLAVNAA